MIQAEMNAHPLQSACAGILKMAGHRITDDILYVKEIETTLIPPTRGSAYIMTDFNEQAALEGLRNLDSHFIGAVYDRYHYVSDIIGGIVIALLAEAIIAALMRRPRWARLVQS